MPPPHKVREPPPAPRELYVRLTYTGPVLLRPEEVQSWLKTGTVMVAKYGHAEIVRYEHIETRGGENRP